MTTTGGGRAGSLTVVGTGIQVAAHTTLEARAHMEQADKLIYLVADPATAHWVKGLNPTAESLQHFYAQEKPRIVTYTEMVERILACVRTEGRVCAAFYGHPGVFVYPSHEAIRRAREEGFPARMLPGISAEDCLFADLGLDPGSSGCQSFEATDFLVYDRRFDPATPLILWQIAAVGEMGYRTDRPCNTEGVRVLVEALLRQYPPEHEVALYEAAQYPVCDAVIEVLPLAELADRAISPIATLYVPPQSLAPLNLEMMARLNIALPDVPDREVDVDVARA